GTNRSALVRLDPRIPARGLGRPRRRADARAPSMSDVRPGAHIHCPVPEVVLLSLPGVRAGERVEIRLSDLRRGVALDRSIRTVVVRFLATGRAGRPTQRRGRGW